MTAVALVRGFAEGEALEPRPSTSRELLSESVRRRIQAAILDGTLLPGERLHDDELIGWLGVSRTPIRSALERLCEAGLVELSPHRFTRVAVMTSDGLVDALQILAALHASSARVAVPLLGDAEISRFRASATALPGLPHLSEGGTWSRRELQPVSDLLAEFSRRPRNPRTREAIRAVENRLTLGFRAFPVIIDGPRVEIQLDALGDAVVHRDGDRASTAIGSLIRGVAAAVASSASPPGAITTVGGDG